MQRDGSRRNNGGGISRLSWGVDGYGEKHYFCNYCELVFGPVAPDEIKHKCDTSKPRYHNRDRFE